MCIRDSFYTAIISALQRRRVLGGTIVMGDLTIQGNIKSVASLSEPLTIAMENGAARALLPIANKSQFSSLPEEVVEKVDLVFFNDPERAVAKALE
jgi:ATP-dependent Lon protease